MDDSSMDVSTKDECLIVGDISSIRQTRVNRSRLVKLDKQSNVMSSRPINH